MEDQEVEASEEALEVADLAEAHVEVASAADPAEDTEDITTIITDPEWSS